MAIGTISTYAVFQSTLTDVSKVESDLTTEQEQLSSGNTSQDFTGMADDTQQYLSLDATLARTDQYTSGNQVVLTRINTTTSALSDVINTANSLQSLISQQQTGVAGNAGFQTQLQSIWQSLAGQLNTQVDGQYLFSGTRTNTPTVNPDDFSRLTQPGTAVDSYYQGNTQDMTVHANDNITLTYNVRGDAPGFQNIIAGLVTASEGSAQNSSDMLSRAETLVQQGIQGIIAAQATVNANQVQLNNVNTNLASSKLYSQGLQQKIGNTDIVAISTQVAINQGILQAAFQAFAKISSLHLSNFLSAS